MSIVLIVVLHMSQKGLAVKHRQADPLYMKVEGPISWEPIWTHVKQIESFELECTLVHSLILGSPNQELSF
jgi:hypothetical protein